MYANSNCISSDLESSSQIHFLMTGNPKSWRAITKLFLANPSHLLGILMYTVSMNALFQNHLDIEFLVYCLDSKRNHKLLQNPSPSAMSLPRGKNNSTKLILTAAKLSCCLQGRGKLAAHSLQCGFMGGFRNIHIGCKIRMAVFFSITHTLLHIRFALWESNMASTTGMNTSCSAWRTPFFSLLVGCELGFTPQ